MLREDVEEKRMAVTSILENSQSIPEKYREIITETMMQIPMKDLEKIQLWLDRFILINEDTNASTEHFLWQCGAKHRMRTEPPMFKGDKPARIPESITHDTFAIILNEHRLKKYSKKRQMHVIAHELAHVFLEHRTYGSEAVSDTEMESKADQQANEWGFVRPREDTYVLRL